MGRGRRQSSHSAGQRGGLSPAPAQLVARRQQLNQLIKERSPLSFASGQQPLPSELLPRYALLEDGRSVSLHDSAEAVLAEIDSHAEALTAWAEEMFEEIEESHYEVIDLDNGRVLDPTTLIRLRLALR